MENRGPEAATLHVLPTLWFRNTWAWGLPGQDAVPRIIADGDATLLAEHSRLGGLVLTGDPVARRCCCDNETNAERLWGVPAARRTRRTASTTTWCTAPRPSTRTGSARRVRCGTGSTCLRVGQSVLRVRLSAGTTSPARPVNSTFDAVIAARRAEADEFYAALTPPGTTADEALVLRQALAGMLWGKQFFHYDVARWLDGDPAGPPPPRPAGTGATPAGAT